MSRINLATDLKTRTGAPDKDARLKNAYVEVRGESSAVRRRPGAQGGVAVGSGVAQGGIGFNIAGTDYFIGVWGDTITPYTGGGTTWDSGTAYSIGDHVSVEFEDYWALTDNTNSDPTSNPSDWNDGYVPSVPSPPATYATWNPSDIAGSIILSNGNLTSDINSQGGARSTIGKSSGKWYWEIGVGINVDDGGDTVSGIGVMTGTAYLGNEVGNFGADEWGYNMKGGLSFKETNGIFTAYGSAFGNGNILGIALDMDNGTIELYNNGTSQGLAFSGLSGTIYAGVGSQSQVNAHWIVTANFGASAFAYSVPSGYNSGLYTP